MKPWLLSFLSCQECSGELAVAERTEMQGADIVTGTLTCSECELAWPILAGVPLMLADPGTYLASYRESVLATLVEHGCATGAALGLIDQFAAGCDAEARRYSDDWTSHERLGERPELATESSALLVFQALAKQEQEEGLQATVATLLGARKRDVIVELGPGAGGLSRDLAGRCERLLLVDFSLRSLLCSRDSCLLGGSADGGAAVAAVLGDASALEMASDCVSMVVAANLVDLLDEPEQFLIAASRWLVRGGGLILTTPEPSLGSACDDTLREMLKALEYTIEADFDGIPWLRMHSPRYSQLYWLQALRATIAA